MSDSVFAESGVEVTYPGRPRAFDTIVYGGLVAGVLDISYAMIFFGIRNGAAPTRILHSVAAGLIGRDAARAGGWKTAVLGLLLHFFIAFSAATVFYCASLFIPILIRHPLIVGPLYGVAVYAVMNYIVLPLSAIGPSVSSPPWLVFLTGVGAIAFLVGLPIALFAKRSARNG